MTAISDLLLRITGDDAGGESAIDRVSNRLKKFEGESAEATADVDVTPAENALDRARKRVEEFGATDAQASASLQVIGLYAQLDRAKARLDEFSKQEASPSVDVKTAAAAASIDRIQLKIDKLDMQSVNVDVDVQQGAMGRLDAMILAAGELGQSAQGASESTGGLRASFGGLTGAIGPVSGAVAALAVTIGTSLVVVLGALVASLAAAVAGLVALGVAAAGVGVVLGGFIIGAVQRFKKTVGDVGSAAHTLKKTFIGFRDTFAAVTATGADKVFRGIGQALRALTPMVATLKPFFTELGSKLATALKAVGQELARPEWRAALQGFLAAGVALMPAVTVLLVSLLRFLRDIGTAALPFLIKGTVAASIAFSKFVSSLGGVKGVSGGIAFLVENFRAWLGLIGAVSTLTLGLFKALAPLGLVIVKVLTDGANALSKWVNSAEGQSALREFFADVIPVAKELGLTILALLPTFLTMVRILSLVLAPALSLMRVLMLPFILGVQLLSAALLPLLQLISGPLTAAFSVAASAIKTFTDSVLSTIVTNFVPIISGAFNGVVTAANAFADAVGGIIGGAFGGVLEAARALNTGLNAVWTAIKTAAGVWWEAIKVAILVPLLIPIAVALEAWDAVKAPIIAVWNALKSAATTIWTAIRSAISAPITAVVTFLGNRWGEIRGAAASAWSSIRSTIMAPVNSLVGLVEDRFAALRTNLSNVWGLVKSSANSLWGGVKSAITGPVSSAASYVSGRMGDLRDTLSGIWARVRDAAAGAWSRIQDAIGGPIRSALGFIRSLADDFYGAGQAIMLALRNGIVSVAEGIYNTIKSIAQRARNFFPGSEPRDPSSPLRNLADSGKAIMTNLAAGLPQGARLFEQALTSTLSTMPATAVAATSTSSNVTNSYNINVPAAVGGGQPDAGHTAALLNQELRRRGGLG